MKVLLSFVLLVFTSNLFAQVDDELGFIYVKAEYMMETERYREATAEFSKIISKKANFKDALLKRAVAYNELNMYDKALADAMDAIYNNGITPGAAKVLGIAHAGVGNYHAAHNSLDFALQNNYKDASVHMAKAECYKEEENFTKACEYWGNAANMGSNEATMQQRKYCREGGGSVSDNSDKTTLPGKTTKPGKTGKYGKGTVLRTNKDGSVKPTTRPGSTQTSPNQDPLETDLPEEEPIVEEPKIDMTVNEIDVDEDLSLVFKNGIGSRKVLDQPNILILSEAGGDVAVDVCINSRGKVETASLNKEMSSIDTPSLVSLATRKAKEFWFEKSDDNEMCGVIVFKIK